MTRIGGIIAINAAGQGFSKAMRQQTMTDPAPPPPGHGPTSREYSPYGQSGNYPSGTYPPPQDYRQSQYSPQPQDDPRNGSLNLK